MAGAQCTKAALVTNLWEMTASELVDGYRRRLFTPLDALASIETRIDSVNSRLNAIIAEDRAGAQEQAEASARRWEAGEPISPIDGVPMTIKDNLLMAGLPATWGSRLYADHVPAKDEAPVRRLRSAGAVFLGKTNVPEFTLQGYTFNLLFGKTRNPHALEMTPGGSTGGGAAAVAAGIGPIAIGTDGGGSLRRPAAHCGLFALKPSIGQVARYGGFPEILFDFSVVGPAARSVEDIAMIFAVLAGYDPIDPSSLAALAAPKPLPAQARIAYLPKIGDAPVDPLIAKAANDFAAALVEEGHHVETISTPYDAEAIAGAWSIVAASGVHWHLKTAISRDRLGANALVLDRQGAAFSAADYASAMAVVSAARSSAGRFFTKYDLLLCPSTAALAWPANEAFPTEINGQAVGPRGHAIFTGWMNVSGICAMNVPVAMTTNRGGIGMQLVAAAGRDAPLLDFVRSLQCIHNTHTAALSR